MRPSPVAYIPQVITVLAPIRLAADTTERQLLAASDKFQREFIARQDGILRRELLRTGEREYLDIVQFRDTACAHRVMEEEKKSPACRDFFALMDSSGHDEVRLCPSLVTYG